MSLTADNAIFKNRVQNIKSAEMNFANVFLINKFIQFGQST